MPKNPSRKLPIQQHGLATVLHTYSSFFSSVLANFSIVRASVFSGFNNLKVMVVSFSPCHFAFVFQRPLWLCPAPALIFRIGHELLDTALALLSQCFLPLPFLTSPTPLPFCPYIFSLSSSCASPAAPNPKITDVNARLTYIWDNILCLLCIVLSNEMETNKSYFNPLPPSFHLLLLVSPHHSQNSLFLTLLLPSLFPFFTCFIPNPILLTLSFLSLISLSLSVSLPVPVPILPPLSFTLFNSTTSSPHLPPCPSSPSLSPLLHFLPFPFLLSAASLLSPLLSLFPRP